MIHQANICLPLPMAPPPLERRQHLLSPHPHPQHPMLSNPVGFESKMMRQTSTNICPPPYEQQDQHQQQLKRKRKLSAIISPPPLLAVPPSMNQHPPPHMYQSQSACITVPQPTSVAEKCTLCILDGLDNWMEESYIRSCFSANYGDVNAVELWPGLGLIQFATHAIADSVIQTYKNNSTLKHFRLGWCPIVLRKKNSDHSKNPLNPVSNPVLESTNRCPPSPPSVGEHCTLLITQGLVGPMDDLSELDNHYQYLWDVCSSMFFEEGLALVEFNTRASAEHVLKTYKEDPNLNHLTFEWAPLGSWENTPYPAILVGDLTPDVSDSMLLETFRHRYPFVKDANVAVDIKTGLSAGFGFVRFRDELQSVRAAVEMNGELCSNSPMRILPITHKDNFPSPYLRPEDLIMKAGSPANETQEALFTLLDLNLKDGSPENPTEAALSLKTFTRYEEYNASKLAQKQMKYVEPDILYKTASKKRFLGLDIGPENIRVCVCFDTEPKTTFREWFLPKSMDIDVIAGSFQKMAREYQIEGIIFGICKEFDYGLLKHKLVKAFDVIKFVKNLSGAGKLEDMKYTYWTDIEAYGICHYPEWREKYPQITNGIVESFFNVYKRREKIYLESGEASIYDPIYDPMAEFRRRLQAKKKGPAPISV